MNLRAVYRQFRAAHSEAEIAMEALVKALLTEGISEDSFRLLKLAVYTISDPPLTDLLDARRVGGKVYLWNVEVTNG